MGLDSLNSHYFPALKRARLLWPQGKLGADERLTFVPMDLEDGVAIEELFARERPRAAVQMAAQVGVRYSIKNAAAYIQSNLVGFGHVREGCRHIGMEHLVYASSSLVYGGNRNLPFSE